MSWFGILFGELHATKAQEVRWRGISIAPETLAWPRGLVVPTGYVIVAATLERLAALAPPHGVCVLRDGDWLTLCGTIHEEDFAVGEIATALRAAARAGIRGDAYLADETFSDVAWHIRLARGKSTVRAIAEKERSSIHGRALAAIGSVKPSPRKPSRGRTAREAPVGADVPPPVPVARSIEELEAQRVAGKSVKPTWGCAPSKSPMVEPLTAGEIDVLLDHHWRVFQSSKGTARQRARDALGYLIGWHFTGDFPAGFEVDHDEVKGTRLCDRAIEIAGALKFTKGQLAKIKNVRDRPLPPALRAKREEGARTRRAIDAFAAGRASPQDITRILDSLLLAPGTGFRTRDRVKERLSATVFVPDERLASGARARLTTELVERARDDWSTRYYGIALLHICAISGDAETLRRVFEQERKVQRKYASGTAMARCAGSLLLAATSTKSISAKNIEALYEKVDHALSSKTKRR
jgi:hypothetical protein